MIGAPHGHASGSHLGGHGEGLAGETRSSTSHQETYEILWANEKRMGQRIICIMIYHVWTVKIVPFLGAKSNHGVPGIIPMDLHPHSRHSPWAPKYGTKICHQNMHPLHPHFEISTFMSREASKRRRLVLTFWVVLVGWSSSLRWVVYYHPIPNKTPIVSLPFQNQSNIPRFLTRKPC